MVVQCPVYSALTGGHFHLKSFANFIPKCQNEIGVFFVQIIKNKKAIQMSKKSKWATKLQLISF